MGGQEENGRGWRERLGAACRPASTILFLLLSLSPVFLLNL